MARYTGPKCRLCRREGVKLFLKGKRCEGAKCPFEGTNQRTNPPGAKGWSRGKVSTFGRGLREKQKIKRIYGILEKQMRRYFKEADRKTGNTGENLVVNVVRRLGFGLSGSHARQLVAHGHIYVNGKRVDIPSYQVRPNDVITVTAKDKVRMQVKEWVEQNRRHTMPSWLELDDRELKGKILNLPKSDEPILEVNVQPVVELLSK